MPEKGGWGRWVLRKTALLHIPRRSGGRDLMNEASAVRSRLDQFDASLSRPREPRCADLIGTLSWRSTTRESTVRCTRETWTPLVEQGDRMLGRWSNLVEDHFRVVHHAPAVETRRRHRLAVLVESFSVC